VLDTMSGVEVADAAVTVALLGTSKKADEITAEMAERKILTQALCEIVAFVDPQSSER